MRILLALLLLSSWAFTQTNKNISNLDLHAIQRIQSTFKLNDFEKIEGLKIEFPIYSIGNQTVLSVLAKVKNGTSRASFSARDIAVGSVIREIWSLKIPIDELEWVINNPYVEFLEIASKARPHLERLVKDIRADSVQNGINLPEKYTGKDVLIGITDWGFDYTHPMFYDTAMTQTRIHAAWDQYKTSGPAPSGFSYGTEIFTPSDLIAAGSDTSNIYSYAYHGSHVAGIAGGGGAGTINRGVAFDAQFLFATFLIDAGSVLDAYQWMKNKADAAGKRLVVNQSWGLHHIGNLDGTSLLSQAIDAYSGQGVVFVSSGGNNGNVNFHLKKEFSADTLKTKVEFYNLIGNPNAWGQSITVWGEQGNDFALSFQMANSANTVLVQTPFYSTTNTTNYIEDTLISGADSIIFNLSMESAHPQNSRPQARLRIRNTTNRQVFLHATAPTGTVHFWNVTELTTDVGNWGIPFTAYQAGSQAGDANYGIGEPACTQSTIAVAAYASGFLSSSGNMAGGMIATFSSFGPTLDERVKPDISAPGVSVASSVSSFTDAGFTSAGNIPFNGRTYHFTRISGTSMSGPAVTGVVALILDANPFLSADQVKNILQTSARADNNTGVIPSGGSLRWGAGKVNAYAAIQLALNTVDIEAINKNNFIIYPNPSKGLLHIEGQLTGEETYTVFDFHGKLITKGTIQSTVLDFKSLQQGAYLLKIQSGKGTSKMKFIVE